MGESPEDNGSGTRAAVLLPWERPGPNAPVLRGAEDRLEEAKSLALGIALDVLVGMIILGVFFFQIRDQFDSLDIRHMERLKDE